MSAILRVYGHGYPGALQADEGVQRSAPDGLGCILACPPSNAAIDTGTHPAITTRKNIETFKRQIGSLGFSYDWDREVNTTDPGY